VRVSSFSVTHHGSPRPWLLLEVVDEVGRMGLGDAAPLPGFSRESLDAAAQALACTGRVGPIDDTLPPAEALAAAIAPIAGELAAAPSARLALETALLDILAQRRAVTVAELLGGTPGPVPLNALVLAPPPETLPERAVAAARGFPALKIKLRARDDEGFARELAALREVRVRLPLPFELRLDANGAWSLDEARRRLDALAPVAPRFVEQPVAPHELVHLGETAVPWAADESLVDPVLADALLGARGCAAFVLKPALLGGLLAARSLALRALGSGHEVVLTHLFDGPCSLAAAVQLASSLPRPPLACGLAPHEQLLAFAVAVGGSHG
jgi:o-succinylbenzoate synthase